MSKILAIDTSCDDTSIAIVEDEVVLVNIIASQVELHKQFGGVFPTVAKQAHQENLEPSLMLALKRTGLGIEQIDAIGITVGPGLAPALEVGITFAKKLAIDHQKPLIAVNHIEGHLLSPLAKRKSRGKIAHKTKIKYPVLGLVISGGHSDFILMKSEASYERVGFTIDDAAGECLDKIGRMIGLGYPAGAVIEEFAKKGDEKKFEFPLPMTESRDYNLSFSGMKTFARNLIGKLEQEAKETGLGHLDQQTIFDLCASAQYGVFRHILHKLEKFLEKESVAELWLGGGVAANVTLRKLLRFKANQHGLKFRSPIHKKLCADNAAMIGVVAAQKLARSESLTKKKQIDQLDRMPRWHIGEPLI